MSFLSFVHYVCPLILDSEEVSTGSAILPALPQPQTSAEEALPPTFCEMKPLPQRRTYKGGFKTLPHFEPIIADGVTKATEMVET